MDLLACDFDGTLFCHNTISEADLCAVRRWRAAGNLFGIVTGRGFMTLQKELVRYPLQWDFLLCNNGALLLDNAGRTKASRPLKSSLAHELLTHVLADECDSIAVFSDKEMHVLEGFGTWVNPVYRPPFISREEALQKELIQVSFGFGRRHKAMSIGERLKTAFNEKAHVQCSLSVADMTAWGVGKGTGIEWACEVNGWKPQEILTAGDDGNDVEMLARFEGYAMEGADEAVQSAASGIVKSIADLVALKEPGPLTERQ